MRHFSPCLILIHGPCVGLDEADLPLGGSTSLAEYPLLILCMYHRPLLLGFERRDQVSIALPFGPNAS